MEYWSIQTGDQRGRGDDAANRLTCRLVGSCLVAGLFFLTGCSTYSQNAGVAMSKLKAGNTAAALKWSEKLENSVFSKNLGQIESGRIKMLAGDFTGSRADFATVINQIIEETETGPVIHLGSVGTALTSATVTDDTLRKYQPAPYEVIQLLYYQTLNYLFCGDPEGAGVEMRRTVFAQDAIAEKRFKEVQKKQQAAEEEAQTKQAQSDALASVESKMATMGPVMERTRSSFENGLAWYFCGVLFEKQGDQANAALCYRKAWELAPDNPFVFTDFMRLLRTQDSQRFAEMAARHPVNEQALRGNRTEIIVLYEESLISQRRAEKVMVPVPDFRGAITYISIDFPLYIDPAYRPRPLTLWEGGAVVGETRPAVYLQSLAYRDLKEKIPGIVFRNVTRALTKVATQQAANNQNDDRLIVGMMIFNAASSIASTSDTRAWYSIPMGTQLYRGAVEPGTHLLHCRAPGSVGELTIPVTVAEGETRLVWIAAPGGIAVAATASLSEKGLPPTFQQFNNTF